MQKQSLDFIIGYVFAKVDKAVFKHFWTYEHRNELIVSIDVPKIWFGLTSCSSVTNDITGSIKYSLREKICNNLKDSYPKLDIVCERIVPEKQYIRFDFRVKRKEVVKKMTIAEVEEALGYKIEIVSDK